MCVYLCACVLGCVCVSGCWEVCVCVGVAVFWCVCCSRCLSCGKAVSQGLLAHTSPWGDHLSHVWTSPANVRVPSVISGYHGWRASGGWYKNTALVSDSLLLNSRSGELWLPSWWRQKSIKMSKCERVIIFEGVLIHFCLIAPLENMWLTCKPYRILWDPMLSLHSQALARNLQL